MDAEMRACVVRGLILQALDLEYPDALSDMALQALLHGAGRPATRRETRKHLEYLCGSGKEYLEILRRSPGLWLAKLTPKGKDLLAGVVADDPGIFFAREPS